MISAELRCIARSIPAGCLAALLLLLEALPANRMEVWDGLSFLFWLQTAWGQAGFWGGIVAVMLAQRDTLLGATEYLVPSSLSRVRYLGGQMLAMMLSLLVFCAAITVVVFLRDPPENLTNFHWWLLLDELLLAFFIAAFGLLVGHRFRSPLALVLPVVAWFSLTWIGNANLEPYTVLPILDVTCSRILGCPNMPYLLHHGLWLGLLGLLLLATFFITRPTPWNQSLWQSQLLSVGLIASSFLIVGSLPILAQVSLSIPKRIWNSPKTWLKLEQKTFDTPFYRQKLACVGATPTVCLLQGQEQLATRVYDSLLRLKALQPQILLRDVIAYPDLVGIDDYKTFETPTTLYISETSLKNARTTKVYNQTTNAKTGQVIKQHITQLQDLILIHAILDHILFGKRRQKTIQITAENIKTFPVEMQKILEIGSNLTTNNKAFPAELSISLYLEWLALRDDAAWTEQQAGINDSTNTSFVYMGIFDGIQDAKQLWKLGQKNGHAQVVKRILKLQKTPAIQTMTFKDVLLEVQP
jgi:hypothetical protein